MLGSSWVAAQLAASREGLSSMSEWVKCTNLHGDFMHVWFCGFATFCQDWPHHNVVSGRVHYRKIVSFTILVTCCTCLSSESFPPAQDIHPAFAVVSPRQHRRKFLLLNVKTVELQRLVLDWKCVVCNSSSFFTLSVFCQIARGLLWPRAYGKLCVTNV
jgi:hypothetical protein